MVSHCRLPSLPHYTNTHIRYTHMANNFKLVVRKWIMCFNYSHSTNCVMRYMLWIFSQNTQLYIQVKLVFGSLARHFVLRCVFFSFSCFLACCSVVVHAVVTLNAEFHRFCYKFRIELHFVFGPLTTEWCFWSRTWAPQKSLFWIFGFCPPFRASCVAFSCFTELPWLWYEKTRACWNTIVCTAIRHFCHFVHSFHFGISAYATSSCYRNQFNGEKGTYTRKWRKREREKAALFVSYRQAGFFSIKLNWKWCHHRQPHQKLIFLQFFYLRAAAAAMAPWCFSLY